MRNPSLHAALREFALEAAAALTHAVESGDELGYDLAQEPGSGSVLYSYRALTAEYIGAHWHELAALPSVEPAARELGAGAATWLRSHGMAGAEAEPALRAMLERLYQDASSFDFPEERFERVYGELERTLFDGTARVAVVAPLRGARIESARVELGPGIALVRGDAAQAPREAAWPHPQLESDGAPGVLIVIERDAAGVAELPRADRRHRPRAPAVGARRAGAGRQRVGQKRRGTVAALRPRAARPRPRRALDGRRRRRGRATPVPGRDRGGAGAGADRMGAGALRAGLRAAPRRRGAVGFPDGAEGAARGG